MSNRVKPPLADVDVQEAVVDAIESLDFVREAAVALDIQVEDGVVSVTGVVLTRIMQRAVLTTVASVPGVQRVIDNLWNDTELEITISRALVSDDATRADQPNVGVSSYRGDVTLYGEVSTADAANGAAAATVEVAGVRSVLNRLTVPAEEAAD